MSDSVEMARVESLRSALVRLDSLLSQAVLCARNSSMGGTANPCAGLCVTEHEVETLLGQGPLGARVWRAVDEDRLAVPLQALLGLSDFELDVVLLALAPEIDLKYEKLFAFLNDDVTRKWPTVDVALGLLCASAAERLEMYRHFSASGSLFSLGVLRWVEPDADAVALLSRRLKLDPVVVHFICGGEALDERLQRFCTSVEPVWHVSDLPLPGQTVDHIRTAVEHARYGRRVRVSFEGPEGCGQEECAEALARALGATLLVADFSAFPEPEHREALRLLLLHCRLYGQVPLLKALRWLPDAVTRDLLSSYPGTLLVQGFDTPPDETAHIVAIVLERPTYEQRGVYWHRLLRDETPACEQDSSDALASVFEFSFAQIRAVLSDARHAGGRHEDLMEYARRHSSRELAARAELIEPTRSWRDLVLHEDASAQLHELCDRVRRRHRVLGSWGFGRERRGVGVSALFVGASGTGKTMAAEIVAGDLGVNLYRIDLSAIVSKYVGETEKNLECIFRDATHSNAVLLFDEADALFGKRSAVRDAHDRYANVEVAYLLQRLESYSGVAVLTTNLSENLDPSFTRRLAYTVHFPFPGPRERGRIWQAVWPREAPLTPDFEADWLAERFKLSGGNIRNIALAAACMVEEDAVITMSHILRALRREYQKMGKALSDAECSAFTRELQVASS